MTDETLLYRCIICGYTFACLDCVVRHVVVTHAHADVAIPVGSPCHHHVWDTGVLKVAYEGNSYRRLVDVGGGVELWIP